MLQVRIQLVYQPGSGSRLSGAIGFEAKFTDAPKTTRSMRVALQDLELAHLYVVYPGEETYPLDERITALAMGELHGAIGNTG